MDDSNAPSMIVYWESIFPTTYTMTAILTHGLMPHISCWIQSHRGPCHA